jgi:hypothetical protein
MAPGRLAAARVAPRAVLERGDVGVDVIAPREPGNDAGASAGQLAGRVLAARRRLAAHSGGPGGQAIDGEGIQLSVDLDLLLMGAGIRPEEADGMTDDEIRALLDPDGHTPGHTPSGCGG